VELVVVAASPPLQAASSSTTPVRIVILVRIDETLDLCWPNRGFPA